MHSNNSINKIITTYTIALIPLILYGFYKNGIIPYQAGNENIYTLFKPLIIPILAFFLATLFDKLFTKNSSFTPLLCTMSAMSIPINSPLPVYIIVLIICLLLTKTFLSKINIMILSKIIIAIYLVIFATYTYQNVYELSSEHYYDFLDLFFGRSSGGLAATSTIICLLSYAYLATNDFYKKEIPPLIIGSFLAFSLCFIPELGFREVLNRFLDSTIIFSSIFLATIPMYSPITKKETIIYSLFIGLTSSLLVNTVNVYESAYLIILIAPLVIKLSQKISSLTKPRHLT